MKAGFALNIERLYGPAIIRVASKHLLRELAAELGADSHIDAARIKDNVVLRGPDTSVGVAALAKSLMDAAGVTKCRKGAVTGLELLFTLPATAAIDPRQYFEQATRWAEQYFGVPVLSCVLHMDEGSPHAHALLLPLVDGRMGGSDLHGGKAKLAAMQASFHEAVAAPHGLPKYLPQKRLSAPVRAAALDLARQSLQANAALNDDIIDVLLAPHAKDPAPLLLALGIAMPTTQTPAKDFVSMMITPCNPEKRSHIGKGNRKPIGKADQRVPTMAFPESSVGEGNPASVGEGNPASPNSDHEQPHQPAQGMQDFLRTSAPAADEVAVGGLLRVEETPSAQLRRPDQPAPASPVQAVSLAHAGAGKIPGTPTGLQKIMDTPQAVHQLDTPESVDAHPQPGATDMVSHSTQIPGDLGRQNSAEILAQLDVSSFARISSLTTGQAKATQCVELVEHHQTGARRPAAKDALSFERISPAAATTSSAPCANGMRPHKDVSRSGSMCQGGSVSPPPAGVANFGQAHAEGISNSGDAPTAGSDLLKTQQVDHRADDYQRQRDDEQPVDAWCADLGEFVQATGPPASRSHQQ